MLAFNIVTALSPVVKIARVAGLIAKIIKKLIETAKYFPSITFELILSELLSASR